MGTHNYKSVTSGRVATILVTKLYQFEELFVNWMNVIWTNIWRKNSYLKVRDPHDSSETLYTHTNQYKQYIVLIMAWPHTC